ncbi:4-hydroxythreonine-4-phosphate dehydrogenase PdxA [Coraliomargarita parva]|uniref:4-hydroxythreonine-4-phosphate dehydrogenase PdxA n=1 Tax=Coraliomargarita parva TaxID=3014050 RepID=UPI0022B2F135|nr:4-hydroxythreonine-4-phosphate dehydrogenase PdxA [Coraliomargarita parva]
MTDAIEPAPLALTCGDPAGIGPEVVEQALLKMPELAANCVLLGPQAWGASVAARTGADFVAVGPEAYQLSPGQPDENGARVALAAMDAAAAGCREGRYRAVVTGPVSKSWLQRVGYRFPGQTEFFADAWAGVPTMAFVGQQLKVVLATWHLPLREVPLALTADCLELAVRRAYDLGRALGVEEPRIAVAGLNPHAGEDGILGTEERDVLDPCLDRLRETMPGLSRCLPGDTVFFRQVRGEFDVVVGAYHDQALAAVKTLEFDAAVNVTLGLRYVRTSPDHGTAFDLAGKGAANPDSMIASIRLAAALS